MHTVSLHHCSFPRQYHIKENVDRASFEDCLGFLCQLSELKGLLRSVVWNLPFILERSQPYFSNIASILFFISPFSRIPIICILNRLILFRNLEHSGFFLIPFSICVSHWVNFFFLHFYTLFTDIV